MKAKTNKTTKPAGPKPRNPNPIAAEPSRIVLCLRTCPADMIATGKGSDGKPYSFTWPRSGPVECPDWDPAPKCGTGLHGLAWGDGDGSLLSYAPDAVWMVVAVHSTDLVKIDEKKVKFRRGEVVFAGSQSEAIQRVLTSQDAMAEAQRAAAAWDVKCGDYSKAASSGDSSTAASSGDYSKAASSGYSSTAASSGISSKAASSGDSSTAACEGASGIAVSIGNAGKAKAGPLGLVIVTHWVAHEKRYRACVGNVGEDGIIADQWYRVANGKLVPA